MTTTQPLAQWPRWRDELVYRLRRMGMDGRQVGEVLKEVDAHLRETGESPERAFGDPATYAASRAVEPHPVGWTDPGTLAEIGVVLVGGGIMIWSAVLIALDARLPFALHPLAGTVAGLVILFLALRQAQRDNVVDPGTGRPMLGSRRQHEIRAFIAISVVTVVAVSVILMIPRLFA